MKRTMIAVAGLAFAAACGVANAASWSVFVEPGVYGRVAIGGYAEPPVVYEPEPVMVVDDGYGRLVEETVDAAYATDQPPVYLWVPEYQRLHWARYCRDYGAYGVPVYFVDDGWYRANVMRRNWTPEQRSWTQQQWLEQDRLARDRFERQRFEQQRYEQQQRWIQQREWRHPRSQPDRRDDARDAVPGQPGQQAQQAQNNAVPRPQPGGQWPPQGGQWQQRGGQWQQVGNAGAPQGYGAHGGWQHNGGEALQGPPASQPGGAPGHGGANQAGERRGDERGADVIGRRGRGEAHGGYERGREGRRDR